MSLRELSDVAKLKSTRSDHFKEHCRKGDESVQSCGWNRGAHLCARALRNDTCVKVSKILE